MSRSSLAAAALLGALVTPSIEAEPAAACPVAYRDAAPVRLATAIRLDVDGSVPERIVERAISLWKACSGYGDEFPRFVLRGEADRSFRVRFERRRAGEGHCATLFRGEIVVYRSARDTRGRHRPCGALEENLAHELGHVLGLGHGTPRPECGQRIMSILSTTDDKNLAGRSAHPEECRAVSEHWLTWAERDVEERRALAAVGVLDLPAGGPGS